MKYTEILSRPRVPAQVRPPTSVHSAHCHLHGADVSRRQFLYGAASLTACAATLGGSVPRAEGAAAAPGIGLVTPIPATIPVFGVEIHVQAPPFTGADTDPSSVYNFRGTTGIAFISGTCERTDRKTGESRVLPYSFNDMRFMQGRFMGRDGPVPDPTFAFT